MWCATVLELSRVSMDEIASVAKLTKRTFYPARSTLALASGCSRCREISFENAEVRLTWPVASDDAARVPWRHPKQSPCFDSIDRDWFACVFAPAHQLPHLGGWKRFSQLARFEIIMPSWRSRFDHLEDLLKRMDQ
jgi:hypothetical protein